MKPSSGIVALASWFVCLGAPAIADAAVFKCVGKDGKTSYQQTACAESEAESRVTLSSEPSWEIIGVDRQAAVASVVYLDVNRIVTEGSLKRAWVRTEMQQDTKVISETVTEQLFDCANARTRVLTVNGKAPPGAKTDEQWTAMKEPTAEKVLRKVCGG